MKSYVEPVSLYRFRSLAKMDQEVDAIGRSYLWCSSFLEMNDPMEGLFRTGRRFRKSSGFEDARRLILDRKARLRLCSFCEVNTDHLMWAHYADQFRGICISYDLKKLTACLDRGIVRLARMFYSDDPPTVHGAHTDIDGLAKMILSYKSNRWGYEREWRLFSDRTENRAFYRNASCIRNIRLGDRVSPGARATIADLGRRLSIKVLEMHIEGYEIKFKPVK